MLTYFASAAQEVALARLRQIRAGGRAAFLVSQDMRDIASYRLLLAIEAALALCYHVSARQLKRVPDDYAGCCAGLSEAGVIAPDLSARLQQMARFRNLLVHVYCEVDYNRVFDGGAGYATSKVSRLVHETGRMRRTDAYDEGCLGSPGSGPRSCQTS